MYDLQDKEMRCEGGSGRLPSARSALPSWSFARLFLTHVRLVEGGRLDARRRASAQGTRKRQLARKWRAARMAHEQRTGFEEGAASAPPGDALAIDDLPPPSKRFLSAQKACQREHRRSTEAITEDMEDEVLYGEMHRRLKALLGTQREGDTGPSITQNTHMDHEANEEPAWLSWMFHDAPPTTHTLEVQAQNRGGEEAGGGGRGGGAAKAGGGQK